MGGRPTVETMEEVTSDSIRGRNLDPGTAGASRGLQVNPRQRGNPILKFVRNVPYEITPGLLADFIVSPTACVLFISLTFHLLRPDYLVQRIKSLAMHYTLRVLLCMVDVEDNVQPLLEMNKITVLNDFTLVLAWTPQEAARYLETYKAFEQKSSASIQEKVDTDFLAKLQDCLGTVRSLNKSDVLTLASNFGSLKSICDASVEDLGSCPGLGDKKVARVYEALHSPLSATHSKND
ncbi:unnamed protein product [Discosporangium mesarthrocarpum]